MNNAILVKVSEPLQHLPCVNLDKSLVKCKVLVKQLPDGSSRHELQNDIDSFAILGNVSLEVSNNVRVRKGLQHSNLMFNSFKFFIQFFVF